MSQSEDVMKRNGNVGSIGIYSRLLTSFTECRFYGTHLCFLVLSAPWVLVISVVAILYSLMLVTLWSIYVHYTDAGTWIGILKTCSNPSSAIS